MDGGRFFGASRACSGIMDGVVLNHAPIGCSWGVGLFKLPVHQGDVRHACTVIHETEIVFGGEISLRQALIKADELYKAPLLMVISGDVPSITGDDVMAVIDSLSLNKDVVWIDAAGFKGSMKKGYEDALVFLAEKMKEGEILENSVNLIGLSPDDFKVKADLKEIGRLLDEIGVHMNSVISHCCYQEFQKAPSAELNLVLGRGVALAETMKNRFGIPYLNLDYPYGLEGTERFLDAISDHIGSGRRKEKKFDSEPFRRVYLSLVELQGTPISIIGDLHAPALASFLEGELGLQVEVIAGFEDDYDSFCQKVKESNTTILFGSSFERNLAEELKTPLIVFSYPAFDQVCLYDDAPYAGPRGAVYLTENLLNTLMGFRGFKCN